MPRTQQKGGPRQAAALEVIRSYWRAFGQAPTREELGRALGISKVSAHLLVNKLVASGQLVREPRRHRNVAP